VTDDPADGPADAPAGADWPVDLRGVTETVVTTLGPNGRWNAAALGVHAPGEDGEHATARTWGRTRTRGNFARQGEGHVQFVADPLVFVEAALSVSEHDDPVLEAAAAWTRVEVRRHAEGSDDGTEWVEWTLRPVETVVREGRVPALSRGRAAVIEATVWVSRLGVEGYDDDELRDRIDFLEGVVEAAGGERDREAFGRLRKLSGD
jgi:hypothetical protein